MKKKFLIPVLLLVAYSIQAQDSILISCRVKDQYISFVQQDKDQKVVFILLEDINHKVIDTLVDKGFEPVSCKCNDSIATFFGGIFPIILFFKFDDSEWKYHEFYTKPAFPLTGMILEGQLYENYTSELISPTELHTVLKVYRGKRDGGKVLEEQYEIVSKVLPNPDWKPDPTEPPSRRNHNRYKMKMVEKVAVPIRE